MILHVYAWVYNNRLEYLDESWRPDETCCAQTPMKDSQGVK